MKRSLTKTNPMSISFVTNPFPSNSHEWLPDSSLFDPHGYLTDLAILAKTAEIDSIPRMESSKNTNQTWTIIGAHACYDYLNNVLVGNANSKSRHVFPKPIKPSRFIEKSSYMGVKKQNFTKEELWVASIRLQNGAKHCIGYFKEEIEAARGYNNFLQSYKEIPEKDKIYNAI